MGLVLRYSPLYRDLRAAQAEGKLGDVVSIEASEHIPPYHGAFFMRDWRRYEHYSGSFMLEKCCHDLDLYNGVVGARPRFVSSFGGRKSFTPANAPQNDGINDMEVYHRKPSGWMGSDKVFDSDGDIIDYQTAIVEYETALRLLSIPISTFPMISAVSASSAPRAWRRAISCAVFSTCIMPAPMKRPWPRPIRRQPRSRSIMVRTSRWRRMSSPMSSRARRFRFPRSTQSRPVFWRLRWMKRVMAARWSI
ncbi:oxidoreductase [Bradyrhizobium lupini HPC(L)]|uniref:Oxidoreductase n=1 Tax=Bradyrhizobium lupini HPC(L) TaxID=1229491 RepID=A0ABN0HMX2_RHILU|nr:oxidoreductase [Bradyrhizobium lupini HPC(L)]